MAITKIQSNAFPASIDLSNIDLTIGAGEILTANIADNNVTHAKLHTDMDLSGKTVTLPDQVTGDIGVANNASFNVYDANSEVSGRIRNWSSPSNSIAIESDPNNTAADSFLTFTIDSGRMMTIDSDGKVGIGTDSPSKKFAVSSSGANGIEISPDDTTTSTNRILSYNRSTNAFTPLSIGADDIRFYIEDSEKVRIDSEGNVGIGVDPSSYSSYKAVIRRDDATAWPSPSAGSSSGEAVLALINNSQSSYAYSNLVLRAGTGDCGIAAVYQNAANNSDLVFYTDAGVNGSEQMRLTHEGNFGIGTTSPNQKFTVYNGNILLDGPSGSDPKIEFHQPTNTGEGGVIVYNDADEVFTIASRMGTYGDINFATGMNDGDPTDLSYSKMFIRANGNVGIGTTDPGDAKFNVQGSTIGNGVLTRQGNVWTFNRNFINTGVNNNSITLFTWGYDHVNWNQQWIKVEVFNEYYYNGGESAWVLDSQGGTARELYSQNTSGSWSSSTTQINSNLTRRTWTWNGNQYRTYGFRLTFRTTPVSGDPNSGQIKLF